jgi:hypothetical protein
MRRWCPENVRYWGRSEVTGTRSSDANDAKPTSTVYAELISSPSAPVLQAGGRLQSARRRELQRATVKSKLQSRHVRIRENAVYTIGIEDLQTQINTRHRDFRGAYGVKIDGIAGLFPRLDGASVCFASDFISLRDKAGAELFGKLSKADFIASFDKDFAALVSARRPGSGQVESVCLRRWQEPAAKQESVKSN